ncbi:MAG: hypothetical protein QXK94_04815 [Candidatus Jordarchaeales archaeon]
MERENVCLDSDVLIDHLGGKSMVVDEVHRLKEKCILSTTSINVF